MNCCERIPFASRRTENLLLPLTDQKGAELAPHLPTACEFLDRAKASGRACLVHCMVGASRSVAVVLAYLMAREGMGLGHAWRLVKQRRPVARPNRGFAEQLIAMDEGRGGGGAGVCLADFGARYA